MKLTNKINLATTVLFLGLLILLNGSIYYSFSELLFQRELSRVTKEAEKAVESIHQLTENSTFNTQDLLRANAPLNGMIRLIAENNQPNTTVLTDSSIETDDYDEVFYPQEKQQLIELDDRTYAFVSFPIVTTTGSVVSLQVTESLESTESILQVLRWVLMIGIVVAIIPVTISSRALSRVITRPIRTMTSTMKEIQASGQFKRLEMTQPSKDELYQMAMTFNRMIDLLEKNYDKQGQFISNASHELHTPLTIIESYASMLKRRGTSDEGLLKESIEAIHSEAIRMKELTKQLFLMAKREEDWKVECEEIPLQTLLQPLSHSYSQAYGREVDVRMETEDLTVVTDPQKCKQMLYIFLDNARKYSDDAMIVSAYQRQSRIYVEIKDHGIGIAEDDLEKVFDRFYRVDESRHRKTGGFGLGLSLAKELATAMNIEIGLLSKVGEGTTVRLMFPSQDIGSIGKEDDR